MPVFSPDGRLLAASGRDRAGLWEVSNSSALPALLPQKVSALAFSPNGQTLACGTSVGVVLWEVAAGQERCRIEAATGWSRAICFSPDGRLLARADDNAVGLLDIARGRLVRWFRGHDSEVTGLVFTADSRALVSSSSDSTLLVWDAGTGDNRAGARPDEFDAATAAAAWQDLANLDAKAAFRATWMLAEAPSQSLPLLKQRLRPAPPVDAKRIERLLAALDSDHFSERERTVRELQQEGEVAEPAVRRFLAGVSSLELRRRVERVLASLRGPVTDPDRLRHLRALEVLETIGNRQARQVLESIAGGTPDARLTQEAKASLERLARRPTRHPERHMSPRGETLSSGRDGGWDCRGA
jgi:hypothetical protein